MKTIAFTLSSLVLATATLTNSADAATLSYGLIGDVSGLTTVDKTDNNGIPYTQTVLDLADATGSQQLPEATLSVGDTVNGRVTLTGPLTVPANSYASTYAPLISVILHPIDFSTVFFNEFWMYYSNGTQLLSISGFNNSGGSSGSLAFSVYSFNTTTPSFTFDEIVFGGTVTDIQDGYNQSISSIDLISPTWFQSQLSIQIATAPVPVPRAFWLMLLGLGILGTAFHRKCPLTYILNIAVARQI